MEQKFNTQLNENFYEKLREVYNANKNLLKGEGAIETFGQLLKSFKKGSKKFRKLMQKKFHKTKINDLRQLNTTCTKFYINPKSLSDGNIATYFNLWTFSTLSNEIKTFIFKMTSNCLGVGSRIAHFNPNIDPSCTFCRKKRILPAPLETFEHLFVFCPITYEIITKFFSENINEQYSHSLYFFGKNGDSRQNTIATLVIFSLLKYILWTKKLRTKLPTYENTMDELRYNLDILFKTNKNLEKIILGGDLFRQQGRS